MNRILYFIAISLIALCAACDEDGNVVTPQVDYNGMITHLTDNVIIKTYQALDEQTSLLVNTLTILENTPDIAHLEAARQAWRDARRPWEQSEGFLYGPVDFNGLDPAMDSWPVNETDLEQVLAGTADLTKAYIDGLDGTLKGFHTIEYLLFGLDGNKQVGDFSERQFAYLRACGQSLRGVTTQLYAGWIPASGNFGKNFKQAGTSESIYPSQKSVLEEMINGLVGIADEVANGKINDPFVQQNLTLEESRFSANSKADFADNIRSIRNIYLGSYNQVSGSGLSSIVSAGNPALDTQVRQEIEEAITAIESIQGTFTTAIFNSPETVETAQLKVRQLQETLQSQVLNMISNL